MGGGVGHLVLSGPGLLALPVAAAASFSPAAPLPGGPVAVAGGAQSGSATVGALAGTAGGPGAAALVPPERGRGMLGPLLFARGFSAPFAVEGVAVSSLGNALLHHTRGLTEILGGLIILLGLLFIGLFDRF